jgi:gamma-glutamyl phosphate reductase
MVNRYALTVSMRGSSGAVQARTNVSEVMSPAIVRISRQPVGEAVNIVGVPAHTAHETLSDELPCRHSESVIFGRGSSGLIRRCSRMVLRAIRDYQAIDAHYHDLEHTLQGILAWRALLRGGIASRPNRA